MSNVKLATVVEGYPKAPFSIATTLRCRGGKNDSLTIIKSGKWETRIGKEQPNQKSIRMLGQKENYKNLGILEADTIRKVDMKEQ